jgi:hypothetical protein
MIPNVRDEGWIRLRRGGIERSSSHTGLRYVGFAVAFVLLMLLAVLLDLSDAGGVAAIGAALVVVFAPALWDRLWGAAVVVSVSQVPVRAGERFMARWVIGHPERVKGVRVTWRGREEMVLRGYDAETFSEAFLFAALDPSTIPGPIDVAPDAMPSFNGKLCRIVWSIVVETRRDDGWTEEDFPVLVVPARS